jgi:transcription antitermination factor NusG
MRQKAATMKSLFSTSGRRSTVLTLRGKPSVVGKQRPDYFLEQRAQPPLVAANDDWGAICLNPNCERRVAEGMKRLGITMYRPTYSVWRQLPNDTGRQEIERNLMPPYAFIRFDAGRPNWLGVSQTDGVRGIVAGNDRVPIALRAQDIATIADAQRAGVWDQVKRHVTKAGKISAMPEVTFGKGQPVTVSYGPYGGHAATIADVESIANGQVKVLMEMLGAMRVVSVPVGNLEAVG